MAKHIFIFDFDYTMVHTPSPDVGIPVWEKSTGIDWHSVNKGWWGNGESLNTDIFDIPLNKWTHKYYIDAKNVPDAKVYLVTGRLKRMEAKVKNICDMHSLSFDEIHCCTGGGTLQYKIKTYDRIIEENKDAVEITIYDDRQEHMSDFIEWAHSKNIKINIIDAMLKKQLL